MATLQSAMEKYARKTAQGAAAWNAAKPRMAANYARGMQEFFGAPISGHVAASYQAGVNAGQYRGGDPNKWAQRFREKMTGG